MAEGQLVTTAEKVKDFFRRNIYTLLVACAAVIYVCRGLIQIAPTGKTVGEIVADFFLALVFGVSLSKLLGLQGIRSGGAQEKVVKTQALHSKTVKSISPKIEELDAWCEEKTEKTRESMKARILLGVGISYQEYTEIWLKGGIPERYPSRRKVPFNIKSAVWRAKHLKITPLTAATLTAEDYSPHDPFALGDSKEKHIAKSDVKRLASKVFTALGFGLYGVKLVQDLNVSDLIWTCIQIVVFLIFAAITFTTNFFYMTDTYRIRLVRKIDYLEAFRNEKGLSSEIKDERESDNITPEVQNG